jgi:hypothetical protein
MKVAIVDVDNTLYDFSVPWYLAIQEYCVPKKVIFPDPHRWDRWDLSTFGIITKEELYKLIDEVHKNQQFFMPYAKSAELMRTLKAKGFKRIIAAHRNPDYEDELVRWLDNWEIGFDDIHLSFGNKSDLFEEGMIVIDDCPETLSKAQQLHCRAIALEFPWNRNLGFHTFSSMEKLLVHVRYFA